MTKELTAYMIEKVTALMEAPTCCAEAKAVCAEWLEAAGTDKEAEMTKKLIAEVEADIMPVDGLIAFAGSEAGVKVLAKKWLKTYLLMPKKLKRTVQNSAIARPALPVLPLSPKKLNCNLTA